MLMPTIFAAKTFSVPSVVIYRKHSSHPTCCSRHENSVKIRNKGYKDGRENQSGFGFGEEMKWRCVSGCGACCKLHRGPNYPTPQEIFSHDPQLIQAFEEMVGPDGWCKHYNPVDRNCLIYQDRPFFCRVEPEVFLQLYGIQEKSFNSEACRACRDAIKFIYGSKSQELKNFNSNITNEDAMRNILTLVH